MSNEAGKPLGAEVPSLIIIIIRTAAASSSRFSRYVLWEEEGRLSILDDSIIVSFVGISIVGLPRR
jgi:hypothetical protein